MPGSARFATSRHRQRRVFHYSLSPEDRPACELGTSVNRRCRPCVGFAPLDGFPEELLDRICSFMDREQICKTMHICSSLRRVASAHLLLRLGISQCDVRAGNVKLVLSKPLHLIIFVAHICPIQRLECFGDWVKVPASEFQRLVPILRAIAPIPEILIYDNLNRAQLNTFKSISLLLLTLLPQTATDTLLIVLARRNASSSKFSASIHVSRPRAGPPPLGLPPISRNTGYTPSGILEILIEEVTFIIISSLLVALYNVYTIIRCVFCRVFGRGWSVEERITDDVHPERLWFHGGLHVQTLSNNYTLVTQLEKLAGRHFLIQPLRDVPESVYSAFLAALDLQFMHATVKAGSNLPLADLATFVARQNRMSTLDCGLNSIRYSSLISPSPPHISSKIAHISAQAAYIPHLLPLAPNVKRLYLSFPSVSNRPIGPRVFNFFAYSTAIEAIARLPGSHSLALSFTFNLAAAYLPWDIEDGSDVPLPESQLHRVEHLMLRGTSSDYLFTASTIRALLPWLARFPSLRRVSFDEDSVEVMWYEQRLEVAAAIASVCPGMSGAGDVDFEIAEEDEMRNGW
ncbi:hypothetical protein FB45DRAFT_1079045 [Roridomyces roridus]|uniref:F-box domain-containing protein n=1 Tax=Roridomyces roridus TaxID=1738132 RepID=A0AAD7G305_9AGAR|nr:hypothetical protein FB45DRAFT_1079045 [Roridomyces roridus]